MLFLEHEETFINFQLFLLLSNSAIDTEKSLNSSVVPDYQKIL